MAQRYNFTAQTNLGNVADPTQLQDVATKNYVDTRPDTGVSQIALTVPASFSVSGSPGTGNVTLALTWSTSPAGLVPLANLGTGTPTGSNFLRGDGTWAVPSGSGTGLTSVGLVVPAAFAIAGSPLTQNGNMTITWSTSPPGLVPVANLGTGTPTTSTFLRGDGSWVVPPGTAGTVTQVLANNGITVSPATSGAATYTVGLLGNTVFSAVGVPGTVSGARTGDIYLQLGDRGATQPWYGILGTYKYNGTSWDNYAQAGVATGQSTPFTPLPGSLTQVPYYGIYWQHDGDSTKRFASLWRREGLSGTASDYVQYFPPTLDAVVGSGGLTSSSVTLKQITVGLLQVAGNATDSTINIGSSSIGNYKSILIQNVTAGSDMVIQLLMPSTGTISTKHRFTARGQLTPIPTAGQDFVIDLGLNTRIVRLFAESGFLGGSTGSDGNSADPAIAIQFENPLNFNTNRIGGANASVNDVLTYNGVGWVPAAVSSSGVTSVGLSAPPPFNVTVPTVTTRGTLTFVWGTGQVPTANLGAGVANTSTFLRGDGNWFAPNFVSQIAMTVPTGFAVSGSPLSGSGTLAITYSGLIPPTQLGTNTPSNANYLRGDSTWQPAVASIAKQGGTVRNGAIQFIEGDNITITDNGNGSFTFAASGGGGGGAFSSVTAIWTTANSSTKNANISTSPNVINNDGITIKMVASSNPGNLGVATIRLNNAVLTNTYAVTAAFPNYTITIPVADITGNAAQTATTVDVNITIGSQYNLIANDLLNRAPIAFTITLSAFYSPNLVPYYTTLATLNYAYNWTGDYTFLGGAIELTGGTGTITATAESGSVNNQPINGGFVTGSARGTGQFGASEITVNLTGSVTAATTYVPAFYAQTNNSTPPAFSTSSSQTTRGAPGSTITFPTASATTQYDWIATTLPIGRIQYVTPLGNAPLVPDVTAPNQTLAGQTFHVFGVTSLVVGTQVQLFITAS